MSPSSPHDAAEQNAIDMRNARSKTSFDIVPIRDFLHHGREEWQSHSKIVNTLLQDKAFDKSGRDFMTRTERYQRGLAMTNRIYELQEQQGWSKQETDTAIHLLDENLPINLHMVAFEPVFMLQAGPTLLEKYGRLIQNRAILGCYLQTELAHGTNVNSLETTATYISETQEFEIHSPTLTSSKWWIGGLGKTATHGVVQAKLILPGAKDMGPHLFLVQLRDTETHKVLPGLQIGDIGPKALAGFAPTDNGFARFNHVRIPKENMLSKFAQVTDDGKYIKPPHAKLSYGGMLYIRSNMVRGAGWLMAKAATVSIRYTTVRRQGEREPSGIEKQAITYPSVYIRLLPILSHAYVFIQLGHALMNSFNAMAERLATGDTSLLAELHATTSGLKVLCTTTAVQDLEVARRAMGGHGYSAFSGLGRLYADYLPSVTYEGDNFVLDQQVVRAALKSLKALASTSAPSLSPSSQYLRLLSSQPQPLKLNPDAWKDYKTSILLLEWRAALIVRDYAQNLGVADATVNQRVAKAVTEAFVGARVGEIIEGLNEDLPAKESHVLKSLYTLYLLTTVEGGLVDILTFGLLGPAGGKPGDGHPQARSLRATIDSLCQELLPHAIGLTDAFGFSDWELDSALGVYDGRVYNALWEKAQTEPLNKLEVTPAYEESIRPIMLRGRNTVQKKYGAKL